MSTLTRPLYRRWVKGSVVAVVAAGAICTGAGIGTAGTTAAATDAGTTITDHRPWRIHNLTDQALTAGEFHRDQGTGYASDLAFGGTTPWVALKPGDRTAEAFQPIVVGSLDLVRTWGRVCYSGQIWNMPRVATKASDMYVFAFDDGRGGKKLMITNEGAYEDVDMSTDGKTC